MDCYSLMPMIVSSDRNADAGAKVADQSVPLRLRS